MLRMVLGDVASWCGFNWLLSLPTWGLVDVDGLACPLHRPMACSHQMSGHGLLSSAVLSRHCSGRWCLFGGCEALRLVYLVES
jgi:hypothetical protein